MARSRFARDTESQLRSLVLQQLSHNMAPYVTAAELRKWSISLSDLELHSGKSSDGYERFIEPVPVNQMLKELKQKRPWDSPMDPQEMISVDTELNRAHQGENLHCFLITWLNEAHDMNMPGLFRDHNLRCGYPFDVQRLDPPCGDRNDVRWMVSRLISTKNPDFPHITCLLADNAPLLPNKLSVAELWQILLLTFSHLATPLYSQHLISPVTIVSCSALQVRIVQGWVEPRLKIKVRMSRIIDLDQPQAEKSEDLVLILAWMLGKPVGDTIRSRYR